jgi:hypothetical protein
MKRVPSATLWLSQQAVCAGGVLKDEGLKMSFGRDFHTG